MRYDMNAPEIHVLGRTIPGSAIPVFWTGSGIETVFSGTDLYLEYTSEYAVYEDWIRVEMDGATLIRMPLQPGHHEICLLRHVCPDIRLPIRILKEVQPMEDDPDRLLIFHSLKTAGQLCAPEKHKMRLEFVGDSLTAGQGLSGPLSFGDWSSLPFSTEGHYAYVAAEALDAEVSILAQGGWGVASAWNNDVHSIMPRVYDRVCSVAEGNEIEKIGGLREHSFEDDPADVVIINLGTNDANAFHETAWTDASGVQHQLHMNADGTYSSESAEIIISATRDFLQQIRGKRPDSYLLWVYGMCGHQIETLLMEGVQQYISSTGDAKAAYFSLSACTQEEKGSCGHPGRKNHWKNGLAIAREIQRWLNIE